MKRILVLVIVALTVLAVAGCGTSTEAPPQPIEGASITGARLNEDAADEFMPFAVAVDRAGQPIGIDCRGAVTRGNLRVQLLDPEGKVAWQAEAPAGPFAINQVILPPEPGLYRLGLAWDGPATASYSLRWQPGAIELGNITPLALLPGVGMMAVALAFVAYAVRRGLGWRYLGLGALAWVVTVALKFAWAIPINTPLYQALYATLPRVVAGPLFYLYVGALTGVFEVGLVWLAARYTRLGQVDWPKALAFGIGFGALEALLLGLAAAGSTLAALLSPALFPPEALVAVARQGNLLFGLAPTVERVAAVYIHILANVLIFYAASKRRPGYFWLAFAYKTSIDTVAAFAQFWGLDTAARIWTIEAVVIAFGVVGWLGMRWVAARYARPAPATGEAQAVG